MHAQPYYKDSESYWPLVFHDGHTDLMRWFDNHKIEHHAFFASDEEWLTIEEVSFEDRRGRKRKKYVGTIGSDHSDKRRTVLFDLTAPPPPTFHLPQKKSALDCLIDGLKDAKVEKYYRPKLPKRSAKTTLSLSDLGLDRPKQPIRPRLNRNS